VQVGFVDEQGVDAQHVPSQQVVLLLSADSFSSRAAQFSSSPRVA
jgi:hypothetical protein